MREQKRTERETEDSEEGKPLSDEDILKTRTSQNFSRYGKSHAIIYIQNVPWTLKSLNILSLVGRAVWGVCWRVLC